MTQSNAILYRCSSGIYIRIPQNVDHNEEDFREFRIGQICSIDLTLARAMAHFIPPIKMVQLLLLSLQRCLLIGMDVCEIFPILSSFSCIKQYIFL